jgi:hypothetical protein
MLPQEELEGRVRLWVAVAHPIWQEVDVKAPDAMQQATARVAGCADVLLARAQEQGFPADKLPSGKLILLPFQAACVPTDSGMGA